MKLKLMPFMMCVLQAWLEEQVIVASMDGKAASITRLLRWVRMTVNTSVAHKGGANPPIAVCFCGPPGLVSAAFGHAVFLFDLSLNSGIARLP